VDIEIHIVSIRIYILFFKRVSGPLIVPPISGDIPVGQQARGGEHSPPRGARPPNFPPNVPPPESNLCGKVGGRVGVPLGHCPLRSQH